MPLASDDHPEEIGPYRVVRPVDEGGMAKVYEVEDPSTGKRFALKLLSQKGLALPRFKREYRALARLDHPNIIRVFRYGVADSGKPYLVMELLDGTAAQVYLRGKGSPGSAERCSEAARVVACVADALGYLHERRIIHRDLKSSNILVLADGSVKLLDFGAARLLDSTMSITRQGEFIGTFAYAAPEQITGGKVDARSDIYALGTLLYRLLCGVPAFDANSILDWARLHLEETPVPPHERVDGISETHSALVMKMMEKNPEDRIQDAREVARSLGHGAGEVMPVSGVAMRLKNPALVGRRAALQGLRATVDRARPGRMTLVVGAAGSGRERILSEAAGLCRRRGLRVHVATFERDPALGGGGDPETLTRHLLQPLQKSRQPTALFFRDLHQAPSATLQALKGLREAIVRKKMPVLVFGSVLDTEDGPALRLTFMDASRILLEPLTSGEVGVLVGSLLGWRSIPTSLTLRVAGATGGQPGYVADVIRTMVRDGLLEPYRSAGGRVEWLDRSQGRIAVPDGVQEEVSHQLDDLDRRANEVLQAVVVAGEAAVAPVLSAGLKLPLPELEESLSQLVRRGALSNVGEAGWRIRVGLVSEVVLEELHEDRRRDLEIRMGLALPIDRASSDSARMLAMADRVDDAIAEVARYGQQQGSRWTVGWLPVLESVVERVSQARETSKEDLVRFFLCYGRAVFFHDPESERVDQAVSRAKAFAIEPPIRAEVDIELARISRARGDGSEQRRLLDKALGRMSGQELHPTRCAVLCERAASAWYDGLIGQAKEFYVQALEMASRLDAPILEARVRMGAGVVLEAQGRFEDAETELRRALALFTECGNADGQWLAANNLANLLRQQGRLSEALAHLQPHLETVRVAGEPHVWAALLLGVAEVELELFRLGEVRERLVEIAEMGIDGRHPLLSAGIALIRGRLVLAAGEARKAVQVLSDAQAAAANQDLPVFALQLQAYLGEAQGLVGDHERADAATSRAIQGLTELGCVPALSQACASRARALRGREDPDVVFAPVIQWLNGGTARLVRMEYRLAAGAFNRECGATRRANFEFGAARELFHEIASLQAESELVALRTHPWHQRVGTGIDR
ncbi:MAG: protein kinase [Myxococcota bacterium]|nr:protein kinase [Myxococcota bacterium]